MTQYELGLKDARAIARFDVDGSAIASLRETAKGTPNGYDTPRYQHDEYWRGILDGTC